MDKSRFPQGPWIDEPDRESFIHKGIQCLILRNPITGTLNAYAKVPDDKNDSSLKPFIDDIDCHGGVTHSGKLVGEEGYWIGFDTCHGWDYAPVFNLGKVENYRNINYVRQQTKQMAHQLRRCFNWPLI